MDWLKRKPDFIKIMDRAIDDVLGTTSGLQVQRLPELPDTEELVVEISGAMLLPGLNNAMLTVSFSRSAAETVISYITGIFPEQLELEDLYDGVAEIVNQIAGRIKSELAETDYHFTLTPPFAIFGRDHRIIHKSRIESVDFFYRVGFTLIQAELSFIK